MTTNLTGVDFPYDDRYIQYTARHDPSFGDDLRSPRKSKRKRGKTQAQAATELTDSAEGLEAGFVTTYRPTRHETEWLLTSLASFYDLALITDVMAQVKGGKEATVYRCLAHPTVGEEFLAAKVYRPRKFRNLRNDKMYREGRQILGLDGRPAKPDDQRMARALEKGTAFGAQLAHTSWLMYEYVTLERLHRAGAAVPRPYGSSENAILMSYCGDDRLAAPTLNEVSLSSGEAGRLFEEVVHNIELMLDRDLIHGDLSAYNILYWQGRIRLIDFPQVVNSRENRRAFFILRRDVVRVCEYFRRQGVACDGERIARSLWDAYAAPRPLDAAADWSRLEAALEEEG